jgi:Ctr copper transporter family
VVSAQYLYTSLSQRRSGSTVGGMMKPWLHFTMGDNLYFMGWVPLSSGTVFGACIGLFMLAIVERWVAAMRGLMQAYWTQRSVNVPFVFPPCIKLTCTVLLARRNFWLPASRSLLTLVQSHLTRNELATTPTWSHYKRIAPPLSARLTCTERRHSSLLTILLVEQCLQVRLPWITPSCWL